MNNPLALIPAKVRLYAYLGFGLAGLVVSSVAVYFTAVGSSVPSWVGGAAAVLGSLAAPFGAVAGSNTTRSSGTTSGTTPPVESPLDHG